MDEVALFLTGHFDWCWEGGGGDDPEDLTGQRDSAVEGDWSVEVGGTVGGGVDCWLPIRLVKKKHGLIRRLLAVGGVGLGRGVESGCRTGFPGLAGWIGIIFRKSKILKTK